MWLKARRALAKQLCCDKTRPLFATTGGWRIKVQMLRPSPEKGSFRTYAKIKRDNTIAWKSKKRGGIGVLTQTRLSFAHCDVWGRFPMEASFFCLMKLMLLNVLYFFARTVLFEPVE
jgi:hypothetical protein